MSKRIVILGAGESGVGAALLAHAKGFDVFVSDLGEIKEEYRLELENHAIEFEFGQHSEARILNADEVVKSPGIPDDAPLVKQLVANSIPVISEIEFAARHTKAKFVAITGTNGKTTTTLLTYHLLKEAGMNVGLAGNVGNSLARQVVADNYDWYVLELSSFQLDGMFEFKASIAVLLNITPDHLDRYQSDFSKYVASKFRIIRNQTSHDKFIYFDDDAIKQAYQYADSKAIELVVSTDRQAAPGASIGEDTIELNVDGRNMSLIRTELPLAGDHNAVNASAAALIAMLLDVNDSNIKEGLSTFINAPHRMEKVAEIEGVQFINDSKATNVEAAKYALLAYPSIVWIAGGKDKGNHYNQIKEIVEQRVKSIICLGVDNRKIIEFFKNTSPVAETTILEEAIEMAFDQATAGDTVLLSPACASFDLFDNYEQRGDLFRDRVVDFKAKREQ